ncbi:MAG: L,D-transpeptidase family protein [Deltaproteobacteria bacterium]|nr:L,D-transpeptidase family protein [Deltaproteobacteria bacterium]
MNQAPDGLIDPGANSEPFVIVVEKSQQRLFLYEYKGGQYFLSKVMDCSTGENVGDKTSQGDKKTPEGFYIFNKKSVMSELAPLYGILAYPMDYPNFWDKRLNKEGSGIWLHGINKKLTPLDSNGCVELKNIDILGLEELIKLYDTPILVYHDDKYKKVEDLNREAARVKTFVENWRKAWIAKSIRDYKAAYADDFLSDDGKNYQAWVSHKERLFKQYNKIKVDLNNLRIFRHQGMIVVLFDQYYHGDEHFVSNGIKRLYLREKNGKYEIASEVWDNFPPKPAPKWLPASIKDKVLAEESGAATTVAAAKSETSSKPKLVAKAQLQQPVFEESGMGAKTEPTEPAKPEKRTPAKSGAATQSKTEPKTPETTVASKQTNKPEPKPEIKPEPKPSKDEADELRKLVDNWLNAWRKKDLDEYIAFYHPDFRYRGMNVKAFKNYKADLAKKYTNVSIKIQKPDVQLEGSQALVTFVQDFRSDQHRDYGLKTLIFKKDKKDWRIKEESWQDISAGAKQ